MRFDCAQERWCLTLAHINKLSTQLSKFDAAAKHHFALNLFHIRFPSMEHCRTAHKSRPKNFLFLLFPSARDDVSAWIWCGYDGNGENEAEQMIHKSCYEFFMLNFFQHYYAINNLCSTPSSFFLFAVHIACHSLARTSVVRGKKCLTECSSVTWKFDCDE